MEIMITSEALYVDDGLLLAESRKALDGVLDVLKDSFEITEGSTESFAGIQIQNVIVTKKQSLFTNDAISSAF